MSELEWTQRPFDIVCLGRVAVDLYSEQIHAELSQAQTFRKYVGGCAGNIAVGCARLGLSSLMLSKVGQDAMGEFVIQTLAQEGVNTQWMSQTPEHLTGLVLLGMSPPDHFPLMFYRDQCADMHMTLKDCKAPWEKTKALLLTGTGFSSLNMRNVSRLAMNEAHARQAKVVIDLDFRPVLWGLTKKGDGEARFLPNQEIAKNYLSFLKECDLMVGTEEEFLIASGKETLEQACAYMHQQSEAVLVIKKGAKGCDVLVKDEKPIHCAGFDVEVLNVLGAGDAFLSGFLKGWLEGKSLKMCGHYANAAGAIVVTRHGCAPAMPYWDELQYFLAQEDSRTAVCSKTLNQMHQKPPNFKKPFLAMLAFDHRTQFEHSLEETEHDSSLIKAFKQKVFDGFQLAQTKSVSQGFQLGCLIDPIYASEVLIKAAREHDLVGVPIEKAHCTPLEWIENKPLYEQIVTRPQEWLIKVLVHLDSDMSLAKTQAQVKQLTALTKACARLNRSWMLELISNDLEFVIKSLYQREIYPTWWKVKAPQSAQSWQALDQVMQEHDGHARVLMLGGDQSPESLQQSFQLARSSKTCQGFVFGRVIFWEAWEQVVANQLTLEEVPVIIAQRFTNMLEAWQQAEPHKTLNKEGDARELVFD